jgi:hypothetical protein
MDIGHNSRGHYSISQPGAVCQIPRWKWDVIFRTSFEVFKLKTT